MDNSRQEIVNEIYTKFGIDISDEMVDRSILYYKNLRDLSKIRENSFRDASRRPVIAFERRKYSFNDLIKMLLQMFEEYIDEGSSDESSGGGWWKQYKKDISRDRIFDALKNRRRKSDERRLYSQTNQDLIKIREKLGSISRKNAELIEQKRKADEISLSHNDVDITLPVAERLIELKSYRNKNQ